MKNKIVKMLMNLTRTQQNIRIKLIQLDIDQKKDYMMSNTNLIKQMMINMVLRISEKNIYKT